MVNPKISILTTAYNAGRYLADAVTSVVEQDFSDWELVLIDNGSDDGSFDRIEIRDSRIKVHRSTHNLGRTPALQLALSLAQGEYIAILDADDIAKPNRLSIQSDFLNHHPEIGIVGSYVECIDEEGQTVGFRGFQHHDVDFSDEMGFRNVLVNSSTMFRRNAAMEIGGYDERFQYAQDYDLAIRLIANSNGLIIPEVLVKLRLHPNSITSRNRHIRMVEEHLLAQKAGVVLPLSDVGREMNRARQVLATAALSLEEIRRTKLRVGLSHFRTATKGLRSFKVALCVWSVLLRRTLGILGFLSEDRNRPAEKYSA